MSMFAVIGMGVYNYNPIYYMGCVNSVIPPKYNMNSIGRKKRIILMCLFSLSICSYCVCTNPYVFAKIQQFRVIVKRLLMELI